MQINATAEELVETIVEQALVQRRMAAEIARLTAENAELRAARAPDPALETDPEAEVKP